jgi:hypothetical protein
MNNLSGNHPNCWERKVSNSLVGQRMRAGLLKGIKTIAVE